MTEGSQPQEPAVRGRLRRHDRRRVEGRFRRKFSSSARIVVDLLEKYAGKLDKKLPATKVFQFVQVENKIQALLDVAAAASIPIVTKTPNIGK